jgi:hypothetical protein
VPQFDEWKKEPERAARAREDAELEYIARTSIHRQERLVANERVGDDQEDPLFERLHQSTAHKREKVRMLTAVRNEDQLAKTVHHGKSANWGGESGLLSRLYTQPSARRAASPPRHTSTGKPLSSAKYTTKQRAKRRIITGATDKREESLPITKQELLVQLEVVHQENRLLSEALSVCQALAVSRASVKRQQANIEELEEKLAAVNAPPH